MNRYRRHVLLTSRGGSLAGGFFSAENIWGRQRSNRQPGLVAAEAEWLLARWGRKPVHFQDEDLAADPEHAAALCQTFLQHRLRSAWFAQASPGAALTAEWLRLLRRAGCQQLLLELVSADPDVLEAIGQPGPEALAQAVRTCREAGLAVAGVFFVGAPKDTEAAVMRSLAFAREQRIDLPRFNLAVPFPKSRLREYADSHGRFVSPDESAGGARSAEPVFETPEFAAEARRRVFKTACEFSRRQCRYYHIRFWWPPNLLRRTGFEITQELRTWIRAWQWPFRRLRYLWRCHDKVRRNP